MENQELVVCITGAAGHIATAFYPLLGCGQVFGSRTQIKLKLLELPEKFDELQGIKMQIEDSAFQLITNILVTSDPAIAFKDMDVGIFLGGFPRKPGMERSDLLQINNEIFKQQGFLLEKHAKETARILVVANPSNTNCLTLSENCPKIPKKNFTSLMQLDQNRSTAMIAAKANVPVQSVQNMIVWGNHSLTQYPDTTFATINGKPVKEVINDPQYLYEVFVSQAQKRGSTILSVAKQTSFLSAACAVKDHLRFWYIGTDENNWTSMGVLTDGTAYDVPEGYCFAMPVRCKNFEYEIVKGLQLEQITKQRINISLHELENEKEEAQID